AGDPGGAIVARTARKAGVHDDANAVERQARLGDRRGENQLALARRGRRDGGALEGGLDLAVQLVEADVGRQTSQPLGRPLDLGDAGQQGEQAALLFAQRAADGGRHFVLDPRFGCAAEVAEFERVAAALAFDHRRVIEQGRETSAVERRRHREQAEVRAERRLGVEREREAEITVEAALMDFVEQHGGHAGQLGIGLDAVDEDAFRENRHPRRGGALAVEAGRITEGAAHRFSRELGHAFGGGARGKPAGAEHQHLAGAPGLADECGRDRGRLARARRRHQHGRRAPAQHLEQVRQDGMDRQVGGHVGAVSGLGQAGKATRLLPSRLREGPGVGLSASQPVDAPRPPLAPPESGRGTAHARAQNSKNEKGGPLRARPIVCRRANGQKLPYCSLPTKPILVTPERLISARTRSTTS
ncbi:hypothetical protein VF04_36165, partial [Nostoc linckia z7]